MTKWLPSGSNFGTSGIIKGDHRVITQVNSKVTEAQKACFVAAMASVAAEKGIP